MTEGAGHSASRPQDLVLASALASGACRKDAARRAGLSSRTARRRLGDPEFAAVVDRLRCEAMEGALGALVAASVGAVETLAELTGEQYPASVRHGAAKTILSQSTRLHHEVQIEHELRILEGGAIDAGWDR
jgi:hypothetical protein